MARRVSEATVAITSLTCIWRTVALTYTTKMATLAPTSNKAVAVPATGTRLDSVPDVCESRKSEYRNVAMNVPKANLGIGERTKLRSTRGDNWELASCSATSVIEKTTPTKVSMAAAIVDSTEVAAPALAAHHGASAGATARALSTWCMTIARTPDATTKNVGMYQKVLRSRSRR